jgi:hypothetical protein
MFCLYLVARKSRERRAMVLKNTYYPVEIGKEALNIDKIRYMSGLTTDSSKSKNSAEFSNNELLLMRSSDLPVRYSPASSNLLHDSSCFLLNAS